MVAKPTAELSLVNASGMREPRADWSRTAEANLLIAAKTALAGRGLRAVEVDFSGSMQGRIGQLVRLHRAVSRTVSCHTPRTGLHRYDLPSKPNLDWSIGPGAAELAKLTPDGEADFALFTNASGSYASGGRIFLSALKTAAAAAAAAATQGVPYGVNPLLNDGRRVGVSLVDLESGRIVWSKEAAGGYDVRNPKAVGTLMNRLLTDSPIEESSSPRAAVTSDSAKAP